MASEGRQFIAASKCKSLQADANAYSVLSFPGYLGANGDCFSEQGFTSLCEL
jgi:hypothetical protein